MKKGLIAFSVGAGAILLGYALTRGHLQIKALENLGALPELPDLIPTHLTTPDEEELANATYCQLLTAYRQELRRYETEEADIKLKLKELERNAQSICKVYAQNPVYKYHCNGFPICGINEWYTLSGTETDKEAFALCLNAIKEGAKLPARRHKPRSKLAPSSKVELEQLNAEIEAARTQAMELAKKWAKLQGDIEEVEQKVFDFKKRIRDLEAQEVFC